MTVSFRTTRRVEFVDTDMVGLVHFSNFFRYMEAAEVELLQSLGLSVTSQPAGDQKVSFPRRAASCDFVGPARFGDLLDIEVRIEKVGRSSITYVFSFVNRGQPVAHGRITAVCCRMTPEHLESIEIPPDVRKLLE